MFLTAIQKKLIADAKVSVDDVDKKIAWYEAQLKSQEEKLEEILEGELEEHNKDRGAGALGPNAAAVGGGSG
jgi:hypothetical protein